MDYDDSDFQSENIQLAGEGSTNFPPVLRPYALPKFDFDDSLQGHLRFDNLVETEVFLGIESQEHNRWIEDFSRGGSGIEFNSSAGESCSISWHNNVWSEATSSESVEMLLKSVGQEEMIPGQTIIEESDGDQLGSSPKQIEPSLKQDNNVFSSVQDVIGVGPTLPPDKFPQCVSGLNEDARELPRIEDSLCTHEGESAHESTSGLDPSAVGEKCDFTATKSNQLTDGKFNDATRSEVNTCNEALANRTQGDFFTSKVQVDNLVTSMQTAGTSIGELNIQEVVHKEIFTSASNEDGMVKDHDGGGEDHAPSKEALLDDPKMHICAVESGVYTLGNPLSAASEMKSIGEQNTVETSLNNMETCPLKGDSDLQFVEGCSGGASPINPVQDSRCEVMSLSKDIGDHVKNHMHERSPVALEGNTNFEVHVVEVDRTNSGIDTNIKLKMDSYAQILNGQGSVSTGEKNLLETGEQLIVEGNKALDGQCDRSSNCRMGEISVLSSSAELKREAHDIEISKGVSDTLGVFGEGLSGEVHDPSFHLAKSEVCDATRVPGQGDVSNYDRGDGSVEDEVITCKLQPDTTGGNKSDVALNNADFTSNDTLDGCPMFSGNAVTSIEVVDHKDDGKLTSEVGGCTQLDSQEKGATEISTEASPLILNECSQVASELGIVSESEKDESHDTGGLINEVPGVKLVEESSTESRSELQEAVTDKVGLDNSKEPESSPVPCDLIVKEDGAAVVALKSLEEETVKGIYEEASLKGSELIPNEGEMLRRSVSLSMEESCGPKGDVLNAHQSRAGGVAKCDNKLRALEIGSVSADPDKPGCGSPTVISSAELSKRERANQDGVEEPSDQNATLSDFVAGASKLDCSVMHELKDDVSKEDKSFSFDVSPLADLDKRDAGQGGQQSTTVRASKMSPIVERSPSVSEVRQIDSRQARENFHGVSQASNGGIVLGGTRGTPERKTRRASSRAPGKESAKKGPRVKETTPVRLLEQADKGVMSPGPSVTCQLVQSEGMQIPVHVEQSSKKPSNVLTTPASSLPDLNASASLHAVFQQPFTDLQQVQLRAQIFVYGSLIQGAVPEEACMISAFGGMDGGRSIWENAWRASAERLQGQKSYASNSETPLQQFSGARAPDQTNKQGALQSKVISSPAGRANSKGTPSPIVNPIIPPSSPLWSISTPSSEALQSSSNPRSAVLDHNHVSSPLHPYQTPSARTFVGQNTSWLSQSPFPVPWIASPQATAFDSSVRFSALPNTETVKLTPVRESSAPHASTMKHVSPIPTVHSGGARSVFQGISLTLNSTVPVGQSSGDPKSRKRKKAPPSDDLGHISLPPQTRMDPVSASGVTSHFSTSVVAETPPCFVSKSTMGKFVPAASPTSSTDQPKIGDRGVEQRVILSEETLNKVKEAQLHAEDAAALAATAINHSQAIWSQLDKQKNSEMIPDVEAKLSSAAAAIAAAASVAKAAAAAAKVASDAALQAKLMAEEAMAASGVRGSGQNNVTLSNGLNILGATPASILKGQDRLDSSGSIIIAAREAARRRVEAASDASKRAENLDAIVKAAELAAEAVTQAGKVVAMGNPLPLSELVEAGPEGYWKLPDVSSTPTVKLNINNREKSHIERVEDGPNNSALHVEGKTLDQKEKQTTNSGKPTPRDLSRVSMEIHMSLADGISGVTTGEKDLRGQSSSKVPDLVKTVGVFPDSEIGSRHTSITVQNQQEKALETSEGNSIKEGSLVEVFKDGDSFKAAWFLASVLSLKDGEAYVCYTDTPSGKGSGQFKEWIPLKDEGDEAPRIRIPHPMSTIQFEGARKRRRAAMGTNVWSVGDRVDACIRDCWWEGVITEKNKKDETTLTVHFPAQGETSVVRAWQLRPSVIWKDGQWMEWSNPMENNRSSHESDTPQEKRLKLGSPSVEAKGKERMPTDTGLVEAGVVEESSLLDLGANDKTFNIGRSNRNEIKPDAFRTVRSGLQKEGSRVIFGVPKPGKKRKFMDVSKHYVADKGTKTSEANDPVKLAKVPMPQGSGSRGWKNTKIDSREKRSAESKPRVIKSGKPQSVSSRTIPKKSNLLTSAVSAPHDGILTDHRANTKDSVRHDENPSEKQSRAEFGSFSNTERAANGPIVFSSLPVPPDEPSFKKVSAPNSKSDRASKGKLAPSGGKLAKIEEDRVFNGNAGSVSEVRRSNRKIQPTSRLLEGLQSSLSISKIPSVSHDRGHKSQNKNASSSKGNNHG